MPSPKQYRRRGERGGSYHGHTCMLRISFFLLQKKNYRRSLWNEKMCRREINKYREGREKKEENYNTIARQRR